MDKRNTDVNQLETIKQQKIIEELRKSYKTEEERTGIKKTYHIVTFGCQMNSRDSEKISGILKQIGYVETDSEDADFVLYNTCTVRENANNKVYGHLGYAKKLSGIQRAISEFNIDPTSVHITHTGYSGKDGYTALRSLWENGVRPDAVFGASDGITSGAMRLLYEKGVRIPDDISVLGYEDSLLAEYASPALTVIDAHKEQMGKEACAVLMNRIKKPRAKVVSLNLEPSLIIRDSVRAR